MATPTYSYNGKMWKPCPTTSDKNSFFHSAFGKRANESEAFFDQQAKFRHKYWGAFLTYFENTTMPSPLREALKKSWSSIDKYRNASIEDPSSFKHYVSDVMDAGHDVVMGEIPIILAPLQTTEIVVLSVDEPNPIVIRPDVKILGNYPNKARDKEVVVLCLEGNTFSRLEPLPSDDPGKIINESTTEVYDQLSSSLIKYEKGGSAGSKGVEYQVGILTAFLLNSFQKLKNWKLSTENQAAGKFDDVVLEWPEGAVLLQAKHKEKKSKKITLEDLISTTTKNDDFSLPKYFLAYEEIKNQFKIKNVIICTNASVNEKISKYAKLHRTSSDSILFYGNENSMFYTFNDNLLPDLKDSVKSYYDKNYQKKGIKETVITEENIKNFLENLQFYSSYPSKDDMMEVVESVLSRMKQLRLLQGQISSMELYTKVMNWFQQKNGNYITETYAKAIFSDIRRDKHWQRLEEYNVLFQYHFDFQGSERIYHITVEERCLLQEIKVFRTLQNTRTNILYANPDDGVEGQKQAVEAFRLPIHTILVHIWPKTFGESVISEVSNELRWILNKYQYKKVILVAESSNALPSSIGLSCDVFDGTVTFEDFLKYTQDELLKRNVVFQGKTITFKEFFGTQAVEECGRALDADALERLIRGEEVRVGVPPVYLGEAMDRFYVYRRFLRTNKNERDDKSYRPNQDYFSEESVYEVNEKVTVISDIAGMGKSTVLTKVAALVKTNHPHLWVIRIDLMKYTKILKSYNQENKDVITIMELLNSRAETSLKSGLERYVFSMRGKVVLILDGIDEICPDYTSLIVKMLIECKKATNFAKILVTTRPHVTLKLELDLNVHPFELQPFTKENQVDFLTKYWTYYLNMNAEETKRCTQYAEALIIKMTHWITSSLPGRNHFGAIHQQVRMLAEIFQEEKDQFDNSMDWEGCKEYLTTHEVKPKLPDSMSIAELYEMCIEKKRKLFIEKGNPSGNTAANQALIDQFDEYLFLHRNLALEIIVGEPKCRLFTYYQPVSTNVETICKIGIVQKDGDEFHFVHRTFAEYFVAQSLAIELRLRNQNVEFLSYLFGEVVLYNEFNVIRSFFNTFLEPMVDELPPDVFQIHQTEIIRTKGPITSGLLNNLSEEGCVAILRLLLKCTSVLSKLMIYRAYLINVSDNGAPVCDIVNNMSLETAVQKNRLEMVKFLVSRGADINKNRGYCGTSLHLAVDFGFFEMSEFLVQQGADINARNGQSYRVPYVAIKDRHTRIAALLFDKMLNEDLDPDDGIILYTAAYLGRLDILEDLVDRGADINCRVERRETLIFAAARGGQLKTINYLVFKGVDIDGKDVSNNTALHIISSVASLTATSYLLLTLGAKPDMKNSNGLTPLHIAADFGVFELVTAFVEIGTPVDIEDDEEQTALSYAASSGHLDIVKFLLQHGADINSSDEKGYTALHQAVLSGRVDVVKYLVGLNITEANISGNTLLHFSATSVELEVVQFFVELGMDVNVKNAKGNTALHVAAYWQCFNIVEYLVENGANVNISNNKGETVQHILAYRGVWRMIRFLVRYGADLNVCNNKCGTPLHTAVSQGQSDTVRYLLQQGVDVNVRNSNGYTPLEIAFLRGGMIHLFEECNVGIGNDVSDEYLAGLSFRKFYDDLAESENDYVDGLSLL